MKSTLFLLIAVKFCTSDIGYNFFQNSYWIRNDRAELTQTNNKFVSNVSFNLTKINRTTSLYNLRFLLKMTVANGVKLNVKYYKLMENQYKFAGVSFEFSFCTALKHDFFGMMSSFLKYSNVTKCPIKPGSYFIYNAIQDDSKLPPNFPAGQYKGIFSVWMNGEPLVTISWFGAVVYE